MYCADNRKQSSTPRIVRAIRQNSKKRELINFLYINVDYGML